MKGEGRVAMADDWFRNTSWDHGIEAGFRKKLARSRDKPQYLRLQAGSLVSGRPEVALRLLDEYFALGADLFLADVWRTKAEAHGAMGETDSAVAAFEAALAREESFGKVFTNTRLDYPCFIVLHRLDHLYDRALALADEPSRGGIVLPAEVYKRNAVRAVVLAARNRIQEAREAASLALQSARETHSGIARHPTVGLVDARDPLRTRVEEIAGLAPKPRAGRFASPFGKR